ncbi:MAG: NAD(P)-binding domain-containing protein [Thermoplasmata archaeon]|nr:NAD(P)-binding domain-containing protein [Thermoplasmata archaeon]
MKVGILGSGDVARSLAKGFVGRGDNVRLGTRDPSSASLVSWAKEIGPNVSLGSLADAAEFGELAVVATRGSAVPEVLRLAGPKNLVGKVVIDVTNPLVFRENAPPSLSVGHDDSAGEQVQRALPGAHVVKAFNTVGNSLFVHPKLPGGPPDMFICGNDAQAKATVTKVLKDFGWPTVDIGGIEGSRLLEPMCILWVLSAMSLGSWEIAFKILRPAAKA